MKLLIVEDNASLAETTAGLLHSLDTYAQVFEVMTIVPDLESAILSLPAHDAVLCDGDFPLALNSGFAVENWHVVFQEAHRRGIHFVLYSGSPHALDRARENDAPALSKPAAVEDIYAALIGNRTPAAGCCPLQKPLKIEQRDVAGGEHAL